MKRAYRLFATFALLNLLGAGGFVTWLVNAGRLDVEKAREIFAMFQEQPQEEPLPDEDVAQEDEDVTVRTATSSIEGQRAADEVAWRNAERYRTQLEQRLKLVNAARVEVDRRREEFEARVDEESKNRSERDTQEATKGFEKQIEILSLLSPKIALEQLATMSDADAASLLFELETRKVKKIIESAKDDASRDKITRVMQLMTDIKPDDQSGRNTGA